MVSTRVVQDVKHADRHESTSQGTYGNARHVLKPVHVEADECGSSIRVLYAYKFERRYGRVSGKCVFVCQLRFHLAVLDGSNLSSESGGTEATTPFVFQLRLYS